MERAIVEGMRTDSLYIGDTNLRVSQLISLVLVVVCGTLLVVFTVKYTKNPKPIEGIDYFVEEKTAKAEETTESKEEESGEETAENIEPDAKNEE